MRAVYLLACLSLASAQHPSTTGTAALPVVTVHSVDEERTPCQPYVFPPVYSVLSRYPSLAAEQIANLDADPDAVAAFQSIEAGIPKDVVVKGDPLDCFNANFSMWATYSAWDPDCWSTGYAECQPKHPGLLPDVVRCQQPKTVGFTVDDGPSCANAPYYAWLRRQNLKATMYFIGQNVAKRTEWPFEAQLALTDGHEICSHSWSHQHLTCMSNEQIFAELYYSTRIIQEVVGVRTTCMRPPYGDMDDRVRYIAQQLGLRVHRWNADTDDWRAASLGEAAVVAKYDSIVGDVQSGQYNNAGAIILTHETQTTMRFTMQQLPKVLEAFDHVTPVGTCLNEVHPYANLPHASYPTFERFIAGTRSVSLPSPSASAVSSFPVHPLSSLSNITDTPLSPPADDLMITGDASTSRLRATSSPSTPLASRSAAAWDTRSSAALIRAPTMLLIGLSACALAKLAT